MMMFLFDVYAIIEQALISLLLLACKHLSSIGCYYLRCQNCLTSTISSCIVITTVIDTSLRHFPKPASLGKQTRVFKHNTTNNFSISNNNFYLCVDKFLPFPTYLDTIRVNYCTAMLCLFLFSSVLIVGGVFWVSLYSVAADRDPVSSQVAADITTR